MKKLSLIFILLLSMPASATVQNFCDEIRRFRIWAHGSDTYGIWVEFKANPEQCPGGFYITHASNNKDHVLSFLLAEKAQNNQVCIQAAINELNGNRCRLNYAYNP